MIQRSIHYKSDFKLRLANEIDWSTPFKARFFTTRPVSAMEVSYDGTTYKGCRVDEEGKLLVTFDRFTQLHRQGLGNLMMELTYNIDDDQFADNSFDRILAPQKVVCIDDEDNEFELVLGLNGDSHVEVECSVIAAYKKGDPGDTPEIGENGNWWIGGVDTEVKADYSSEEALRQSQEAARVAAETSRQSNETQRQSGETTRQSNETTRQSKETERQTNETARQNAETQRQQTFQTNEAARQTAYQNAEANRNGAYQEAEQDRDEEFASKEATRDAANQAALNCAETLAALGPKISEIAAVVGGTETEVQIDIASGGTWTDGKGVYATGEYEGAAANSSYNSYLTKNISAYAGKKLFYARSVRTTAISMGLAFYTSGPNQAGVIAGAGEVVLTGESEGVTLSSIDIPSNAVYVQITCITAFKNSFYAYVTTTTTTEGLQKDVSDLKDAIGDVVVYKSGTNLFNPNDPDIINPGRFTDYNQIATNGSYFITGFIPVEVGKTYAMTASDKSTSSRMTVFYNSSKEPMSAGYISTEHTSATAPEGAAYMRVCSLITNIPNLQISEGSSVPYEAYTQTTKIKSNAVDTDSIENGAVTAEKLSDELAQSIGEVSSVIGIVNNIAESSVVYPTNLLNLNDPDLVNPGRFTASNTIATNGSYFVSGYIPVTAGTTYALTASDLTSVVRVSEFYDSNKNPVPGSYKSIDLQVKATAPAGAAYLRVCILISSINKAQVSEGETPVPYSVGFAPYTSARLKDNKVDTNSIKDKAITSAKLADNISIPTTPDIIKGFSASNDNLGSGETLYTDKCNVRKNSCLVARIDSPIENVSVGVGFSTSAATRVYMAYWAEITSTQVKIYNYNNTNNVLVATYTHGLTLGSHTIVMVTCTNGQTNYAKMRITTEHGDVWEQALSAWGWGRPFVTNGGNSAISASVAFMPRDLSKRIWVFGDSAVADYSSNARWGYYLFSNGFVGYLLNALPGLSPDSCYTDLQNLLATGYRPSIVVWLAGGNGTTAESKVDGQYVINSYQKQYIDAAKAICDEKGIEIVIGTWPSFPTRQKTGFSRYVRSLGVRYIDFEAGVGSREDGVWMYGPRMYAWTNGSTTIYTNVREGVSNGAATGATVYDSSFESIGSVSSVGSNNAYIVVDSVQYDRDSTNDITNESLISSDGLHPTERGAKVEFARVMSDFPEIAITE